MTKNHSLSGLTEHRDPVFASGVRNVYMRMYYLGYFAIILQKNVVYIYPSIRTTVYWTYTELIDKEKCLDIKMPMYHHKTFSILKSLSNIYCLYFTLLLTFEPQLCWMFYPLTATATMSPLHTRKRPSNTFWPAGHSGQFVHWTVDRCV